MKYLDEMEPKKLQQAFIDACSCGELEQIKYLTTHKKFKEFVNISACDDVGFQNSCMNGRLNVVQYLSESPQISKHVDIDKNDGHFFQWACMYDHFHVMEYLLYDMSIKISSDRISSLKNLFIALKKDPQTQDKIFKMIETRDLFLKIDSQFPNKKDNKTNCLKI